MTDILFVVIVVILIVVSIIAAYFGPKRYLILSGISSLLAVLIYFSIDGLNLSNFVLGLIIGVPLTASLIISGWIVRKRRQGGTYLIYYIIEFIRRLGKR